MRYFVSSEVEKSLRKIKQKDPQLFERITKQLTIFSENPKHPSLRTHKLITTTANMWSISITMSVRMVYILLNGDGAMFVKIGTHDEVYRK